MFKRYIVMIKKYNSFKIVKKSSLILFFIFTVLKNLSVLLIPYTAAKIIEYLPSRDYKQSLIWVLLFLGCGLLHVFIYHIKRVIYRDIGIHARKTLQRSIINKISTYAGNYNKKISNSFLINTSFVDVNAMHISLNSFFEFLCELISMIISIVIFLEFNIYIGLISFVLLLICLYGSLKDLYYREISSYNYRKNQDEISNLFSQIIDGNNEIKAFSMEDEIRSYLTRNENTWEKNYLLSRKYHNHFYNVLPMMLGLGKIVIYLILTYLIIKHNMNISYLVLIIGYYNNMEYSFESICSRTAGISVSENRINRVYNILNYTNKNMLEFGNKDIDDINGSIDFLDVSFNYEREETLKNVSFNINPNCFTCIVGKSGSGKSTIIKLLLRLYKPIKGKILIDNENINNYSNKIYSSNVSVVTSKPFVFDLTIKENLEMVNKDFNKIVDVCKLVGIHDYIMQLKNGYNTKLNDVSVKFSSTNKQLITIARSILTNSEILLFDEITTSLDLDASNKIYKLIKKLKKNHTVVLVTHKTNLMKLADKIIVVDKGRVVGEGNHNKLIKNNKYYQLLFK